MKTISKLIVFALLPASVALAQDKRLSCDILKQIDLKPLIGADHDPLSPFGRGACQAESKAIGRGTVFLTVEEGPIANIKKGLDGIKRFNQKERAKEVKVAAEPELGSEAFSIRENDNRKVEIYAVKGNKAVIVQGMWSIGPTIDDKIFGQLREVAKTAMAKLP
ncbi:MAG TPA: hypothetical protein VJQ51_08370 [Burkholderiales bacterium]|nr:hypothetical protein [Burkholderiales bacterium]